eukprot:scaffold15662_cov109-Isochrysis_galbana.AAC.1
MPVYRGLSRTTRQSVLPSAPKHPASRMRGTVRCGLTPAHTDAAAVRKDDAVAQRLARRIRTELGTRVLGQHLADAAAIAQRHVAPATELGHQAVLLACLADGRRVDDRQQLGGLREQRGVVQVGRPVVQHPHVRVRPQRVAQRDDGMHLVQHRGHGLSGAHLAEQLKHVAELGVRGVPRIQPASLGHGLRQRERAGRRRHGQRECAGRRRQGRGHRHGQRERAGRRRHGARPRRLQTHPVEAHN